MTFDDRTLGRGRSQYSCGDLFVLLGVVLGSFVVHLVVTIADSLLREGLLAVVDGDEPRPLGRSTTTFGGAVAVSLHRRPARAARPGTSVGAGIGPVFSRVSVAITPASGSPQNPLQLTGCMGFRDLRHYDSQ